MEHNPNGKNTLIQLIHEYEALSQRNDIGRFEEKSLLKLANFFEEELRNDKALEVIDFAMESFPFSVEFYLKKVHLLLSNHSLDKATDLLQLAENLSPGDIHVQLLKCKILCLNNECETALSIINQLLKEDTKTNFTDIKLAEACIYEHQREYSMCFDTLSEILNFDDKHNYAIDKIWTIADVSKRYTDSIRLHSALIDKDPYNYKAWYNIGQAYASTGEYILAIQALEYAFIINPQFESAYKECADLCYEVGKHQRALKIYLESLEVFGPDIDIYFNAGQCLLYLGNSRSARKYFNKALKLDPFNDEIQYSIGLTFARESRWINAINAYKRALDIDDMREEYYAGLGEAYFHINEFEKAEYFFKKAIIDGPEQSFIWLAYANYLMATNRLRDAIKLLEKADFYTQSVELEYCKTACYFLMDKKSEGLAALACALEKDSSMHVLLFNFAPHVQFDTDVLSTIKYYSEQ